MIRAKLHSFSEFPKSYPVPNLTSAWNTNLEAAICEHCDWTYLLPAGSLPIYCPHCFQGPLNSLAEQIDELTYARPPELVLPFTVSPEKLTRRIQNFGGGIWLAPGDLNPPNLTERLQRVYLPMWLVDSDVEANWRAEAGFNYEVVSHRDRFDENKGGWTSHEITETRIRWEPRLGRLSRTYHNTIAPALEEHTELRQKLGDFDLKTAQSYETRAIANALIRLPNRLPADAWSEAIPAIQAAAAEDCRRASNADHWRQFRWKAEYLNLNWTLLLLPVYVTYYLDDDKNPQPVLINGQTGRLSGLRRASMKRARRMALFIVGVAVAIFVISLMLAIASFFLRSLFGAAVIGLMFAIIIGLLALVPVVITWQFNRTHPLKIGS